MLSSRLPKIYLEEVYATGGSRSCSRCKGPAEKSLCERHLRQARLRFQDWARRRHARGLCIQCQLRAERIKQLKERARTGLRCWKHRTINRERCRRWSAENGPRIYAELKAMGLCAHRCGRPVTTPHVYCDTCLARMRTSGKLARARARA